jgi:DNA polymerase-3 subunit epsilon
VRAIAIDFETANEQRASPCAVGLAWIEDGAVTRRAYRLIRPPEMRFSPGNIRIHGIRPADVADAGEFPAVMAEFLDDLAGTLVLAHNAPFDMGVIAATCAVYGGPPPHLRYLCTRSIARRAWPGEPSFGLAAMAAKIGFGFSHHHAEEDAAACAAVALAAARHVGTDRIALMAERLALAPRRLRAADPVWAVPARPARNRLMPSVSSGALVFHMRGSTGNRYEIRCDQAGETYDMRCTCMAGLNRRRCRHVTALLDGEVEHLVSDNLYDLAKLKVIVDALGDEAIRPRARLGFAEEGAAPRGFSAGPSAGTP